MIFKILASVVLLLLPFTVKANAFRAVEAGFILLEIIYNFIAEDREDNNKDKALRIDLATNFYTSGEVSVLGFLSDHSLLGLEYQTYSGQREDSMYLNGAGMHTSYRYYLWRKVFLGAGVGMNKSRMYLSKWNYNHSSILLPSSKFSVGVEAHNDWFGFGIDYSQLYLFNTHRFANNDSLSPDQELMSYLNQLGKRKHPMLLRFIHVKFCFSI